MQAIGVVSRGWGIAIKIADGSRRAIVPLAVAILKALGLVDQRQQDQLAHMTEPRLVNLAGVTTGTVRPLVQFSRC
jgi:L-asparaginase II